MAESQIIKDTIFIISTFIIIIVINVTHIAICHEIGSIIKVFTYVVVGQNGIHNKKSSYSLDNKLHSAMNCLVVYDSCR